MATENPVWGCVRDAAGGDGQCWGADESEGEIKEDWITSVDNWTKWIECGIEMEE